MDFVKEAEAALGTALGQQGPLQFIEHSGYTGGIVVAVKDPSSGTSLYFFERVNISSVVGVPNRAGVFHVGPDNSLVELFFQLRRTNANVST